MLWKSERVFTNSREYFDELIAECDAAHYSVEMEFYIFHCDDIGEQVMAALVRAAKRGLSVRLLVDGFGSAEWIYEKARDLVSAGVEVRIFHPLPVFFLPGFLRNLLIAMRWLPYIMRVNQRNHRKMTILDKRVAYVGSQNVFYSYKGQHKTAPWRETGVRVDGPAVSELLVANERAWKRSWSFGQINLPIPRAFQRRSRVPASGLVRLNDTKLKRRMLRTDLQSRIAKAARRIWITNAYFVPTGSLLDSLSAAAKRGIDVRILLPAISDVTIIPWVSAALYQGLLRSGVKIFEYRPFVLHAKTLLIDEWATVGTSNLNHRSLLHDLEVDIVLSEKTSVEALEQAFIHDVLQSKLISMEDWRQKKWYVRRIGSLALIFRRWL